MDKHSLIHLFHIFFVGPLLIYIGINRDKTNATLLHSLLYLGLLVIMYHGYKAYKTGSWVNYIHALYVGPLLVLIGLYGSGISRKYFELMLLTGIAALGYHTYYLFF
jgi:hypothetical protein